ncbi:NAD(P)H-dependent oxidoreductase [Antrihabitans stalactiti]|uniref:NAD(P)H-dependent oxidoreductase n=1 Tax=Antrihabitans stalactiti TaxID=2584121 RepID=A0A848K604_9NOCA|nr:NAD(P)H-dependent oxidoreductase [Antrihabitans stalactiti]NMN94475.1 NAD(P)H-dependent oxidoreductase [Antrihabitans stalactiti]
MTQSRVLALVGSLRQGSVNRQVAEAAAHHAPAGAEIVIFEGLGDLPFYNEDIDNPDTVIPEVEALRTAAGDADAVLVVTPEYNGTIPGVLKNAIDWLSRPYGNGAIVGKPTAVVSVSPVQYGAKWANEDTVRSIGIAGGKVVENAVLTIGQTGEKFGDKHPRENDEIGSLLTGVVEELVGASESELLSA